MDLLYVAVVLTLIAAVCFAIDFARSNWQSLQSLGLTLFASGVTVWLLDILIDQGKLD